jgi:glycerol-3-phosphate acyltransferase PlsY
MSVMAVALLAGAYFVGGIPFGLIIGKAKGVDLRKVGSKNIGATNVARNLGMRWGIVCLVLDALKGAGPTLAARLLLDPASPDTRWVIGGVMLAAVVGHMFTPYLVLRGGKGVATGLGVALAVCPLAGVIAGVLYVGLYAALRISSVGSMALTVSAPVAMWLLGAPREQVYAFLVISLLIVIKHVPNLARLARGEEGKIR